MDDIGFDLFPSDNNESDKDCNNVDGRKEKEDEKE